MSNIPVLITGGAGYIGSHVSMRLAQSGFLPIAYDNLSNGHRHFVRWGPLEVGDIRDRSRLDDVLRRHRPVAIMHFAALIEVSESVSNPIPFYEVNVGGAAAVLASAHQAGVDKLVFSSTCATYGAPCKLPMNESHPQLPLNPYGRSKLMVESMLRDVDGVGGLRSVTLRYFNAAGAAEESGIGEQHKPETHAIPLILDTLMGRRTSFSILGVDYDTRDGTAERDYIHVADLAEAHIVALRYLLSGGTSQFYNVGTGLGTTVRELIGGAELVAGKACSIDVAERRLGDAPALICDPRRLIDELGWWPKHSLSDILRSAWAWHQSLHG